MKFKNLKIGSRLSFGFSLILLLLVSLSLVGINRMDLLSEQTTMMYNHPLTVSNAVLRINTNIIKIHRSMKDVALAQDTDSIEEYSQIVNLLEKDIYNDFKIINERFLGKKDTYQTALEAFASWKLIRDEVITLMHEGKREKAAEITRGKGARHVVRIEKTMEALGDFAQLKAKDFLHAAEVTKLNAFYLIYIIVSLSLLTAILVAVIITKSFTKPIGILRESTEKIGRGNLDTVIETESRDEFAQLAESFNKMVGDLKKVTTSRDELNKEIAERKKAEKELGESEARYEDLYDNAPDMFVSVDAKTAKILQCNQTLAKALGYSKDEVVGHPIFSVYHPDSLEDAKKTFKSFAETGVVDNVELQLKRKDGSKIDVILNASAVRDEHGNVLYSRSAWRDITVRKQAEEKLQEAVKELARSNTDLEQFAYIASHDLKSPLLSISGFANMLNKDYKDKLDKEAGEYIDFIVTSTKRMGDLIDGLLTYSRIGARSVEMKPVDINKIFVRAIANLTVHIEENGAKVIHDSLPTVLANDVQLEQLLQNLIGNAIKFHGHEPPRVHISAEQEGGKWVFSVKDNGIGIAAEDREQIFKMFQRLHRDEYKGTGIGLAACKKIVELHGGNIWMESQPDKGSIFYFTLPCAKE